MWSACRAGSSMRPASTCHGSKSCSNRQKCMLRTYQGRVHIGHCHSFCCRRVGLCRRLCRRCRRRGFRLSRLVAAACSLPRVCTQPEGAAGGRCCRCDAGGAQPQPDAAGEPLQSCHCCRQGFRKSWGPGEPMAVARRSCSIVGAARPGLHFNAIGISRLGCRAVGKAIRPPVATASECQMGRPAHRPHSAHRADTFPIARPDNRLARRERPPSVPRRCPPCKSARSSLAAHPGSSRLQ